MKKNKIGLIFMIVYNLITIFLSVIVMFPIFTKSVFSKEAIMIINWIIVLLIQIIELVLIVVHRRKKLKVLVCLFLFINIIVACIPVSVEFGIPRSNYYNIYNLSIKTIGNSTIREEYKK